MSENAGPVKFMNANLKPDSGLTETWENNSGNPLVVNGVVEVTRKAGTVYPTLNLMGTGGYTMQVTSAGVSSLVCSGTINIGKDCPVTANNLSMGYSSSVENPSIVVDGGRFTCPSALLGNQVAAGSNISINLKNGGAWIANKINTTTKADVNVKIGFDGGVLVADPTVSTTSPLVVPSAAVVEIAPGGAEINTNGVAIEINGPIQSASTVSGQNGLTSAGPLRKTGGGWLKLNGKCTYQGDTLVGEGSLILGTGTPTAGTLVVDGPLPSGTVLILGSEEKSGVLLLGSASVGVRQTVAGLKTGVGGGAVEAAGTGSVVSDLTLNVPAGDTNICKARLGGATSGQKNFKLIKDGAGVLSLESTSVTYEGGTLVKAGVLDVKCKIAGAGDVVVEGGSLRLDGAIAGKAIGGKVTVQSKGGVGFVLASGPTKQSAITVGGAIEFMSESKVTVSSNELLSAGRYPLLSASGIVQADVFSTESLKSLQLPIGHRAKYDVTATAVAIVVEPNVRPEATAQTVTVLEDGSVVVKLAGKDLEGPIASYQIVEKPANGTLSGAAADWTYKPAADYNGTDSFTFTVTDNEGGVSESARVTVNVTPVNDAPSFTKGGDQTVRNTSGAQSVANWATGISAGPADEAMQGLTFLVSNNNNGLFAVQPTVDSTGTLLFTPEASQSGTATVTVRLQDSGGMLNEGVNSSAEQTFTVTVTANTLPTATAQSATVLEDGSVNVTLAGADREGSIASYKIVEKPANGTLSGTEPNLTYTPKPDFNGEDSFTFTVTDNEGGVSEPATVTVSVIAVNDAPSFTKGGDQTVPYNSVEKIVGGWATGISAGPENEKKQTLTFEVSNDNNALFSVQPTVSADGTLSFTPAKSKSGKATVTVVLKDGEGGQSQDQKFTVTVEEGVPPKATPQRATVLEDGSVEVTLKGIVTGGISSYAIVKEPQHGFLIGALPTPKYTPGKDYNGSDSFTFTVTDSEGIVSEPATVTVDVARVNDRPSFEKGLDQTVRSTGSSSQIRGWATNIKAGPENESEQRVAFTVTLAGNPGLFSTAPALSPDGTLSFTPAKGKAGKAMVTIVLKDNGGVANAGDDSSTPVTFMIEVVPNGAPTALAQTVYVLEDRSKELTLSGEDSDGKVEGYKIVSQPAHGKLSGDAPGLTYTPDPDYNGRDEFTFTVTDNDGVVSAAETVSIEVKPVNDKPRFTKGPDQTVRGSANAQSNREPVRVPGWATAIAAGPVDESPQKLEFVVRSTDESFFSKAPEIGLDGSLSFTPAPSKYGTVTVYVSLRDDGGTENEGVDLSAEQSFQVTLREDLRGAVSFVKVAYAGAEGSSGDVTYPVEVTRTGGRDGSLSVVVKSAGGTATPGVDYTPLTETVSWADQEEGPKTVRVTVKKDADRTAAETVMLSLENTLGGSEVSLGKTAVFTILEKADASGPAVRILTPKANAVFRVGSLAPVVVSATVSDTAGIRSVTARVGGGAPVAMVETGGVYQASLSGMDNGRNTVVVTAVDGSGNSGMATVSVDMSLVRDGMAGAYNGLMEMKPEVWTVLSQFGNGLIASRDGLVHLDVTAAGRFTGTVLVAGIRRAMSGVFLNDGKAVFIGGSSNGESLEIVKAVGAESLSLGYLRLNWDSEGDRVVGTLRDLPSSSGGKTLAEVSADLAVYTAKPDPVLPFKNVPETLRGVADGGNYTAVLGALGATGLTRSEYPAGSGVATLTVSGAGVVTLKGRLADGTAVSYSNMLSAEDELPVHIPLYGNRGYLVGTVKFDASNASTDAAGALDWYRPGGLRGVASYSAGWSNGIGLQLSASRYVRPDRLEKGLGTSSFGFAAQPGTYKIQTLGLLGTTEDTASIGLLNRFTLNAQGAGGQGASRLVVAIDGPTGLLRASSFRYGTTGVACSIQGAVLQKTRTAAGYFGYIPARKNPVGTAESGLFEARQVTEVVR